MTGVISYGAYVPLFRMGEATKGWTVPGERSVANFDEDSITLGVEAAIECIGDRNRSEIDALFFATTTAPYLEKQSATLIATAVDLRGDVFTVDCTNTVRAGTTALRLAVDAINAGSAKRALLTVADTPVCAPRSPLERNSGDGAASLLIGDRHVAAVVQDSYSVAREIVDIWRPEQEARLLSWEDRFCIENGFVEGLKEAIFGVLRKTKLKLADFSKIIYPAPDAREHRKIAQSLGIKPEQVEDPLFGSLGNTRSAFALMLLVNALEQAKAGDRILLANYGDGGDAFVLEITEHINKLKGKEPLTRYLHAKKTVPDYETFLRWKGNFHPETGVRRPPIPGPSASALFRERQKNLRFYGVKCKICQTVQYPPQKVCTKCQSKGKFDDIRLSDKRGTLFTYSMDYIGGTVDIPFVVSVVNFEGGGRALVSMTDRDIDEIKVGMPIKMSFRKLYTASGIHNYFWKCVPKR